MTLKPLFEKRVDSRDEEKIKQTRPVPDLDTYDYRLRLVNESATVGDTFSFLAVGDSGAGGERKSGSKGKEARPKFQVADVMNTESEDCDFVLHLGDVVYLSGSKEGYPDRVIGPYRRWLQRGTDHEYDDMVFTKPFLPLYGNHDYFDIDKAVPILGKIAGKVRKDVGTGSDNGRVFQEAFMDLKTDPVAGALPYVTGERTRIPNRYYWFTHGSCAFIALDSNTLDTIEKPVNRDDLKQKLEDAEKLAKILEEQVEGVGRQIEKEEINEDDGEVRLYILVSELAEEHKKIAMLDKYLDVRKEDYDKDQLAWLEHVLQHPDVRDKWKIVYMHHQLYTSETSHNDDPESDGLRRNLRRLFVDHGVHLVLSGHSHCFEWVMRAVPFEGVTDEEVRLARDEQRICYIVSGGGGRELRPSILDAAILGEKFSDEEIVEQQRQFIDVAESKAYSSLFPKGDDPEGHHQFHFLRIEVHPDQLKVIPVGVLELDGENGFKTVPILTKVFQRTGTDITLDPTKTHLDCVNVFRDRKPEGEFS